ncbi:hypothetical protein AAZX31_06G182500 [Glycine max]
MILFSIGDSCEQTAEAETNKGNTEKSDATCNSYNAS